MTSGGSAGAAGAPASDSTTGAGGAGGASDREPEPLDECGDARVGMTEDCEPETVLAASCASLGFDEGTLSCSATCAFDTNDCRGSERCFDGRDNDGDGRVDCFDQDCDEQCMSSCAAPVEVEDGASVFSNTEGHAFEIDASCSAAVSGSEVVFQITAQTTGKLDVVVDGVGPNTVSVRTSCEDDASELVCAGGTSRTFVNTEVVAGETVFVVVEGYDESSFGSFSLRAESRAANECGDEFVDELEQCDDGGRAVGDGCDASCQIESNEQEPNDTSADAADYEAPLWGSIDPAGDIDFFRLIVDDGPKDVVISVVNLASGFCSELRMDPYLELIDPEGGLVASDDDGGEGYCPKLSLELQSGEYSIVVRESPSAVSTTRDTFGYALVVSGT